MSSLARGSPRCRAGPHDRPRVAEERQRDLDGVELEAPTAGATARIANWTAGGETTIVAKWLRSCPSCSPRRFGGTAAPVGEGRLPRACRTPRSPADPRRSTLMPG